jgi:hypothetical protein
MNTTQIRNQVKQSIDQLSPEKLVIVAEFLDDLINEEDATEELLKIEGFETAFERGKQQIQEGKVKDWRLIRDDV